MPNHGCQAPVMYQWETADLEIHLGSPGVLVDADDIVVSIVQGAARLDLHKSDLMVDEATDTIRVKFTQEQAGAFVNSWATVQVNILKGADRLVSDQGRVSILQNLYREAM